jgi:hypothetical protein
MFDDLFCADPSHTDPHLQDPGVLLIHDGCADVRSVDTDGDGVADTTAYLYDDNHDGTIDNAVLHGTHGNQFVDLAHGLVVSDDDGDLMVDHVQHIDPIHIELPQPGDEAGHAGFGADHHGIVGDPYHDVHAWEPQQTDHSCATMSQGFVLEQLTGVNVPEAQLDAIAAAHGWDVGGGTAPSDVGNLLEHFGVDSSEIWEGGDGWLDEPLDNLGIMPGSSPDHCVEVIGIDKSDPAHPMVILNDPGHPDGAGMMVPMDVFEDAWADSGHFMCHTTGAFDPAQMQVAFGEIGMGVPAYA